MNRSNLLSKKVAMLINVRGWFVIVVLALQVVACSDLENEQWNADYDWQELDIENGDRVDIDRIETESADSDQKSSPADVDETLLDGDLDLDVVDSDLFENEAEIEEDLPLPSLPSDGPFGFQILTCIEYAGHAVGVAESIVACEPLGVWKYLWASGNNSAFGSCLFWPESVCYFRLPRNEAGDIVSGYVGCRTENDLYFDRQKMTIDNNPLDVLESDTECNWDSNDRALGEVECIDDEDCPSWHLCDWDKGMVCVEGCLLTGCEAGQACVPYRNECTSCELDCPPGSACKIGMFAVGEPYPTLRHCIYDCPTDCPREQCDPLTGTCMPPCELSCDEGLVCQYYRDDYYCLPPFDSDCPLEWVRSNTGECMSEPVW